MKVFLGLLLLLGTKIVFGLKCYITNFNAPCVYDLTHNSKGDDTRSVTKVTSEAQKCFYDNVMKGECAGEFCVKMVVAEDGPNTVAERRCAPKQWSKSLCTPDIKCYACSSNYCNGVTTKNVTPNIMIFSVVFVLRLLF